MSIPLVRNNTKDAINTSIIAIKKNLERINTLLGLVDSSEPDLSGFATKQELEDTVTEINNTIDEVETSLQPVDTVTSGNMHSVTSNAVYTELLNYASKKDVMPLVKSVTGNTSASLSIADLPLQGVYLVIATDLQFSWAEYNIGILLNYSATSKSYVNISHNNLNITIDGTNIKTITSNRRIWGAKFYKVGYY
jgi:hypothetical protein